MKSLFYKVTLIFICITSLSSVNAQWRAIGPGGGYIYSFASTPTNLYAGGMGVFLSTNSGFSWTSISKEFSSFSVYALAVSGSNLFAGLGGGGIYLTTNNGIN